MAKYHVKFKDLQNQADEFQSIGETLASCNTNLAAIANRMDARDSGMSTLRTQLRTVNNTIPQIRSRISSAGFAVKNIASTYEKTEKSIYLSIEDPAVRYLTGSLDLSSSDSLFKWKNPNAKDIVEQTDRPRNQYAYDRETGQMVLFDMAPKYAKKEATIFERKLSASVQGSLVDINLSKTTTWGQGSINAKIGTAEAHAEFSAGLYVFDKDGKRTLAPSVNAEVGASVSLLTLTAEGTVGSDMLGAYGKADVSVGKAEAKASATASFFDENGNLAIQAKAKASAEAIAFEAKGRAGATILGAEVGVTGSVTVGVGAHAEIGYVDGVVKVDIGASLGIGVSVGFEVNIGGAVDAVVGGAKAIWNTVSGWFS